MTSGRQEESGFEEGRGEAEGMLGCARGKLIQCRMNRWMGNISRAAPPKSVRPSREESKAKMTTRGYNT